jgi:predicted Zn-dependent protease
MRRNVTFAWTLLFVAASVLPAAAQGGIGGMLNKGKKAVDTADSLHFTDAEERTLGEEISAKLRDKYGVVQDREVTKYVTLVGSLLAAQSERPKLQWAFIVLDTDGINAFAAPGGFVHITRGALALISDEAELADVLGHEITHITEKHTLDAILNKNKADLLKAQSKSAMIQMAAGFGYDAVLDNQFSQGQEETSDKQGVALANKVGYAPAGLGAFLTKLSERNKNLKEKSGLFASHNGAKTRLDVLKRTIAADKLTATALVAARYDQAINFTLVPIDKIEQVAPATPGQKPEPAQKSGGSGAFGLGGLNPLAGGKSGGAVSSAAARGVNPDRDAKGGPNKGRVIISVSAAELEAFKGGIK